MRPWRPFDLMAGILASALSLAPLSAALAQAPTTWQEDAKKAALDYADEQAKEVIKSQSQAAIVALYKKLYKSGADKTLVRQLGTVALSANEINKFAENAADAMTSGDPEKVKAASEEVAVALGKTLANGIKDPALRKQMAGMLGNIDKVNEAADVLGKAAGGDPQAAYEYLGRAFIAATPAAAAFTAIETAAGVVSYAKGKFVDSTIEELYQEYAKGDEYTRDAIRQRLETQGLYSSIVRDRKIELADQRAEDISLATAEPSDAVRERLTQASDEEVVDDILQTFAARNKQEQSAAVVEKARAECAGGSRPDDRGARHGRLWQIRARLVDQTPLQSRALHPADPRQARQGRGARSAQCDPHQGHGEPPVDRAGARDELEGISGPAGQVRGVPRRRGRPQRADRGAAGARGGSRRPVQRTHFRQGLRFAEAHGLRLLGFRISLRQL